MFFKSKSTTRKNILQSTTCHLKKKKSKSSQVNILILDFYLLEQSNYKQIKQNKAKKLMKKFVHKLKRKSKNFQANCHEISHEISQESDMMLRASAVGRVYAKCKVHLAFRPQNC